LQEVSVGAQAQPLSAEVTFLKFAAIRPDVTRRPPIIGLPRSLILPGQRDFIRVPAAFDKSSAATSSRPFKYAAKPRPLRGHATKYLVHLVRIVAASSSRWN
jgi:hypothetical protein